MRLRSLFLAATLLVASLSAPATPQLLDETDMWFNFGESGWGLNLIHQGDTMFGSLFVYGPDGQPRWYTASALVGGHDNVLHDQPRVYSGTLYESSGPPFSGPFDPNTVTRRDVGTMTLDLTSNPATLTYSVDGVQVTKTLQRFSFRSTNLTSISYAFLYQPPGSDGTPALARDVHLFLTDDGTTVTGSSESDSEAGCTYSGTHSLAGQYQAVSGTYSCAGGTRTGSWFMSLDPTPHGLVGSFQGNGVGTFWGRVAGSYGGDTRFDDNGWRNGMWFPANESGWGLNVIEQGDTIFASLFVYDAQRRSHWYTGSALTRSGSGVNATFSGPLYESTGPYFGAATFDPAMVTRRQVGTMSFQLQNAGQAVVSYSVDGASVMKNLVRFFFRKNDLSGGYLGHMVATNNAPAGLSHDAINIDIVDGDGGFAMTTTPAPTASDSAVCHFAGPSAQQAGEYRSVGGTYTCEDGESGTFAMDNLFVSFDGFTGSFTGRGVVGHIEGVRRDRN